MELLDGAIDMHVHTAPDQIERWGTDMELARAGTEAGMEAAVVKNHVVPTMDRAAVANEALGVDFLVGGVVLNGPVGGINPDAVRVALAQGAKVVWFPTIWNANHARIEREEGVDELAGFTVPSPDREIAILSNGTVTEPVERVLEIVADSDAIVATGHSSPEATEAIVDAARDVGAPVVVTHPFFYVVDLSIDLQESLAESGATMEFCAFCVQNTPGHTVDRIVEAVNRIGADSCVLATDFGQARNPPVEGFVETIEELLRAGLDAETVDQLVRETPARLLGR